MVAETSYVDLTDLPQYIQDLDKQPAAAGGGGLDSMEAMQRRHAQQVLEHTGGNKVQAAQILGISRATLYRLLGSDQNGG